MLSFKHAGGRFNYRTVGVVVERERLLIHRGPEDDYWALPGGRVEFGEAAGAALGREFEEELGLAVEVGRLLWVVENFFTFQGVRHHELSFYFHVALPAAAPLRRREQYIGAGDGVPLIFQWHPVADLEALPLYPTFLRTAVKHLPAHVRHIVHEDAGVDAT
ncbi:MAG TPA: NUDIX hydrolase [Pyrinomonadaceae bacterium]|jgi:ADP-ribose pyrophosphatase YjhB (NUDIX family)